MHHRCQQITLLLFSEYAMDGHHKRSRLHYKKRREKRALRQMVRKLIQKRPAPESRHFRQKRQRLKQRQKCPIRRSIQFDTPLAQPNKLKFGAMNVNGLDLQVAWVLTDLLKERSFDVSL